MKIAPIFDPSVRREPPKPMQVDLQKAFLFGLVLWSVALIVCVLVWEYAKIQWFQTGMYICCFGIAEGICALIWERLDRWDYRRLGE